MKQRQVCSRCYSDVGRAGGRQELSLDDGCLQVLYLSRKLNSTYLNYWAFPSDLSSHFRMIRIDQYILSRYAMTNLNVEPESSTVSLQCNRQLTYSTTRQFTSWCTPWGSTTNTRDGTETSTLPYCGTISIEVYGRIIDRDVGEYGSWAKYR